MAPLDLNRVYYFVKIVEAGNITSAAKQLNESKAKLSRELSLLEEELGLQLVYRTTRQFQLTDSGRSFYENARSNVQDLLESALNLRDNSNELSGKLRITAPEDLGVYFINKIVADFLEKYPQMKFEILYTNEVLDLVREGVDVAIRIGHFKDSSLLQKKAGRTDLILVASPEYLKQGPILNGVTDLEKHQTLGFGRREWILNSKTSQINLKLSHHMVSNNVIAIRDFAIRGLGIALIPRFICQEAIKAGELVHLLKGWGDKGADIQIVVPQQKNISKRVRAFFDYSTARLKEAFS